MLEVIGSGVFIAIACLIIVVAFIIIPVPSLVTFGIIFICMIITNNKNSNHKE